jgi:serine/threonine protein kinase
MYSTANAIPLNALRTGLTSCGRLVLSFDAIRFGRAWWLFGKYGLVSFELLIVGASIRALMKGASAVPPRAEAAMHASCVAVAVVACAVFYTLCARINTDEYNSATEAVALGNGYNHAASTDDIDDDEPSVEATKLFQSGRNAYDNLVRDMLIAWDALVGVAVVMWLVLRVMYARATRLLRVEAAAAARAEETDEWADTRRSTWEARRQLLNARQSAFAEVAKPLEPYIAVFVVFAAPAFVMSTSFCQEHSGATLESVHTYSATGSSVGITYGTCDVWCEFALAFRSLGTVIVYLVPRERRVEIASVRTTWHKLWVRAITCCFSRRTPPSHYSPLESDGSEHEMLELAGERSSVDALRDSNVVRGASTTAAALESWVIRECDMTLLRRLGHGAFGDVWEARLHQREGLRVAVKVLSTRAVDEDGDLVDSSADEDFRNECAALQRLDNPHLIKFIGFGFTEKAQGFIVTELMAGGSLESALHDRERELPWQIRVSIGLQVALGMDGLHQRRMLHRDLKSANVLLDENFKAKVCDFGLSRVVRPPRQHVVHSPFTGVTRLLPRVHGVDVGHGGTSLLLLSLSSSVLSMGNIGVCIEDAHGTMTKAAGTLLWMAPEVFRGDQTYTNAVDVYSFGVVLWELATRETPWAREVPTDDTGFFEVLNKALQTGRRPTVPAAVSQEHGRFVSIMSRCWAGDPVDRPSFSVAASELAACLRDSNSHS